MAAELSRSLCFPESTVTFSVDDVLGKGTYGVAYRGRLGALDVCVKAYHAITNPDMYGIAPNSPEFDKVLAELVSEATMLQRLCHPNVLQLIGIVTDSDSARPKYVVTELADGTLKQHFKGLGRKVTLTEFCTVCHDILSALRYIHSQGVIHRDLKPENVLVVTRGPLGLATAKVADVGLARFTAKSSDAARRMTTAGTPYYTAPEILLGEGYDRPVDVFSFGVMAAELARDFLDLPLADADSLKVADPGTRRLMVKEVVEALRTVCDPLASLILECASNIAAERPTAVEALTRLLTIPDWMHPASPPASRASSGVYPISGASVSSMPVDAGSGGGSPTVDSVSAIDMLNELQVLGLLQWKEALATALLEREDHAAIPTRLIARIAKDAGLPPFDALTLADRFCGSSRRSSSPSPAPKHIVATPSSRPLYAATDSGSFRKVATVEVVTPPMSPTLHPLPVPIKGTFVSKLTLTFGERNSGLAVSSDGMMLAVSNIAQHNIVLYPLGPGTGQTFGGLGSGPGKLSDPMKLCFHPDTHHLLVTERMNRRVQEFTPSGEHVRFIGVGVIKTAVEGLATNGPLVAVGNSSRGGKEARVMLFDYETTALVREFGAWGDRVGELGYCTGIRFTPDGGSLVVANGQSPAFRLSVFTLDGRFVKSIGNGVLNDAVDVEVSGTGEWLAVDYEREDVAVLDSASGLVVTRFGGSGSGDGRFRKPRALALSRIRNVVFVLDDKSNRVQAFK